MDAPKLLAFFSEKIFCFSNMNSTVAGGDRLPGLAGFGAVGFEFLGVLIIGVGLVLDQLNLHEFVVTATRNNHGFDQKLA